MLVSLFSVMHITQAGTTCWKLGSGLWGFFQSLRIFETPKCESEASVGHAMWLQEYAVHVGYEHIREHVEKDENLTYKYDDHDDYDNH